jgi:hypothetical protein
MKHSNFFHLYQYPFFFSLDEPDIQAFRQRGRQERGHHHHREELHHLQIQILQGKVLFNKYHTQRDVVYLD